MRQATTRLVAGLMRKEEFAGRSLEEAMARYVISPTLASRTAAVHCSHSGRLASPGVVELRCTTRVEGLTRPFAVKHTYSFPLLNEVRESGLVLRPETPGGTTETLVALKDGAKSYVNVAVHDDEGYMLYSSVLTYNRRGEVRPYVPVFPDKFTSPLSLGHADLGEAVDEQGRRVLRLVLGLEELTGPTVVKVGYNTAGIQEVRRFEAAPAAPVVVSDLPLEDNPELLPGEWVIGATDGEDRMLVNGIVRMSDLGASIGAPS
uniref:Cyclodehydratase n=1 Tax=Streptomyces nobilis TaxID=66901 RepID=I2CMF3_9ACTN|nr:cyclodehydratase [Streptomyces nobilis]